LAIIVYGFPATPTILFIFNKACHAPLINFFLKLSTLFLLRFFHGDDKYMVFPEQWDVTCYDVSQLRENQDQYVYAAGDIIFCREN